MKHSAPAWELAAEAEATSRSRSSLLQLLLLLLPGPPMLVLGCGCGGCCRLGPAAAELLPAPSCASSPAPRPSASSALCTLSISSAKTCGAHSAMLSRVCAEQQQCPRRVQAVMPCAALRQLQYALQASAPVRRAEGHTYLLHSLVAALPHPPTWTPMAHAPAAWPPCCAGGGGVAA